jgi:hypothetical protein
MDAGYWADVFVRLATISRKWSAEQSKTLAIFVALIEFHGRLHLLSPEAVGAQEILRDSLPQLRAKHVRGIENLLGAMRKSWERFESLHIEMSELHASVWTRHSAVLSEAGHGSAPASELSEPGWSVVGAGQGLDAQLVGLPPPLECIQWVRKLENQFAAELLLKLELLDSIDLAMSAEALHGAHRLWTLQPHLDPPTLSRITSFAESLTIMPSSSVT